MKSTALLLWVMLFPSCAFKGSKESAVQSALYDPPTVTLIEGHPYQFREGTLTGRGQKFHSDYSYRSNIIRLTP